MTAKRGTKDRFPSILEGAFHDPENCSIDPVAKVALSDDHQEYTWALSLLRNMYEFGRDEAEVFLIGLLTTCGDNWEKRLAIVEVLYHVQTEHRVNVLFGEKKAGKKYQLDASLPERTGQCSVRNAGQVGPFWVRGTG